MVSKELVGSRIRQVRTRQRKTLKEVESASGFSSTHISEIERGRTSPTIGALIRIAHALDKDPSFFVEERELDEVCITTSRDRPDVPAPVEIQGSEMRIEALTRGILGGRLMAHTVAIDPRADVRIKGHMEAGDLTLICLEGGCEVSLGDVRVPFAAGDSIHLPMEDVHLNIYGLDDSIARVLVIVDPRECTAAGDNAPAGPRSDAS